jgi:hypothetical protein
MTAGIGHNNGPSLEPGQSWRRHVWTRARADLLPTLPIEVVRLRVKRAAELGLPYRTYAGFRAATGRDLVGFLFSSNALGLLRGGDEMAPHHAARLAALVECDRTAAVQPPLRPAAVLAAAPLDAAEQAPGAFLPWPVMRDRIVALIQSRGLPADGVLVIGETPAEREWAEAGRTAGFLTGTRYFAALPNL